MFFCFFLVPLSETKRRRWMCAVTKQCSLTAETHTQNKQQQKPIVGSRRRTVITHSIPQSSSLPPPASASLSLSLSPALLPLPHPSAERGLINKAGGRSQRLQRPGTSAGWGDAGNLSRALKRRRKMQPGRVFGGQTPDSNGASSVCLSLRASEQQKRTSTSDGRGCKMTLSPTPSKQI